MTRIETLKPCRKNPIKNKETIKREVEMKSMIFSLKRLPNVENTRTPFSRSN